MFAMTADEWPLAAARLRARLAEPVEPVDR
jgi:hypothetical protein